MSLLFLCCLLLADCSPSTKTPVSLTNKEGTALPIVTAGVQPSETLAEIPLAAGYGVRGTWFELYFTNPASRLATQETGGVDQPLVDALDKARLSIDVAIYNLTLDSVRSALIRAHKRGIRVRMVIESENIDQVDVGFLMRAGIPIRGDQREGLMHDKFVVVDHSEVWTGSMNFTNSGVYEDNNHLIRIHSIKLADDYTWEFEEMFLADKFGADILSNTPFPRVTVDGTPMDVYFSPDDGVQNGLLDLISNAETDITLMAFSFTSDAIGQAIREQASQGVEVRGVMDADQEAFNIGSEYLPFQEASIDMLLDGNDGQMHHKVLVIDGQIVVLGSYNFTNSAEERNDENVLVIYSESLAGEFLTEFHRLYLQTQ